MQNNTKGNIFNNAITTDNTKLEDCLSIGGGTDYSSSMYNFPNTNANIGVTTGYPYPYTNGTISSSAYQNFTMDDGLSIDVEKILKMDSEKKEIVQGLLTQFLTETDYSIKTLLFNTLNSYSLFTDSKTLQRKVKISNISKKK